MSEINIMRIHGWFFNKCNFCGKPIRIFSKNRRLVNTHATCWVNDDEDGTL